MPVTIGGTEFKKPEDVSAKLTQLIMDGKITDAAEAFPGIMADSVVCWGLRKKHVAAALSHYAGTQDDFQLLAKVKFAIRHPQFLGAVTAEHIGIVGKMLAKDAKCGDMVLVAEGVRGQIDLATALAPHLRDLAIYLHDPSRVTASVQLYDSLRRAAYGNSILERAVAVRQAGAAQPGSGKPHNPLGATRKIPFATPHPP